MCLILDGAQASEQARMRAQSTSAMRYCQARAAKWGVVDETIPDGDYKRPEQPAPAPKRQVPRVLRRPGSGTRQGDRLRLCHRGRERRQVWHPGGERLVEWHDRRTDSRRKSVMYITTVGCCQMPF